jgi:predicted Zn finger-like uncharacterized protein
VGHIGGDDFIFIVPAEEISPVCSEILDVFDTLVPLQYNDQDRRAGYFFGKDRRGPAAPRPADDPLDRHRHQPHRRFAHPAQVSELATEMKSYAKTLPGSVFVVDRRQAPMARSAGSGSGDSLMRTRAMNVTCPNCATVYRVDPAKVPEAGVRRACSVCSAVFAVQRGEAGRPPAGVAARRGAGPATPRPRPRRWPARPRPAGPAPERPCGAARRAPHRRAPAPQPSAARPRPGRPQPGVHPRRRRARLRLADQPPRSLLPPAAAPPLRPASRRTPRRRHEPRSAGPSSAPGPPAGAGRSIPFLSQDPAHKARRLARALISDIVVYHPAKRQEGCGTATSRSCSRTRSEELGGVHRAGRAGRAAESPAYFRKRLNEILAGGRQIFER